jgi:hypothetical protein
LGSWPRNSDCRKPSLKAVLGRKKEEGNLTSKANSFHNQTEKEETSFVLYTEAFVYEEFEYFCKRNIQK